MNLVQLFNYFLGEYSPIVVQQGEEYIYMPNYSYISAVVFMIVVSAIIIHAIFKLLYSVIWHD